MALGNIISSIISFHNEARKTRYTESATDLNIAIQLCLNDISIEMDALKATDTDQTLEVDSETLNYPDDYKMIVSIVPINSSSVRKAPLKKLPGGHKQYRELRDNSTSTGIPKWYSEFENKFWIWPISNGSYTTEIEYYRFHPQDITNILFDDQFRNCIYFGTAFFKAFIQGNEKYIKSWGAMYQKEKDKLEKLLPQEPYICEG